MQHQPDQAKPAKAISGLAAIMSMAEGQRQALALENTQSVIFADFADRLEATEARNDICEAVQAAIAAKREEIDYERRLVDASLRLQQRLDQMHNQPEARDALLKKGWKHIRGAQEKLVNLRRISHRTRITAQLSTRHLIAKDWRPAA